MCSSDLFPSHDKGDYVNKQVETEQQQYNDRDKDIDSINDELSGIEDWKRYFFVLMEQEGDIDIDEDYYNEMVEEIDDELTDEEIDDAIDETDELDGE